MVQEFYTEKELEQKKIAMLEEKAHISYFPANFRQNKERTQEEHLSGQTGHWESEDEQYASDGNSEHSVSNLHSNATSNGNSMRYVNAPRSRRASTRNSTSTEYSMAEIQAAVAAAGAHDNSAAGFAGPRTSFTSLPPSSVKMDHKYGTTSAKHSSRPVHESEQQAVHAAASGNNSRKPSTDSTPIVTPTSRLSLKMQNMLNRRGSYNPAEIRLELLASIHDDQVSIDIVNIHVPTIV